MITEKEIYDKLSEDEAHILKEICRLRNITVFELLEYIKSHLEGFFIEQEKKKLN